MDVRVGPVIKGLISFIPGACDLLPEARGDDHSARYCHGVWIKHLALLWANGVQALPHALAELGPGRSLGVGLAALLSGVSRYLALDVVRHADTAYNLKILDELVGLFRSRAGRAARGWPDCSPYLDSASFPSHILSDDLLRSSLAPERIARIRKALVNPGSEHDGITIRYIAPWSDHRIVEKETVDLVLSHVVLGQVSDLPGTYQALHAWLKPGGTMSHQIGLGSFGLTRTWNGHRAYPDLLWKMASGRRPYFVNRAPHSEHIRLIEQQGFEILCDMKLAVTEGGVERHRLAASWKHISDEDLSCHTAFIQARKPRTCCT
jgi:hypothetical protein